MRAPQPCSPFSPPATPRTLLQIAACPEVAVVSVGDVSAEALEKEKAIEMGKEDILSKPEAMRCVVIWGRGMWTC